MKYSVIAKFIAIMLAALMLTTALAGVVGVILIGDLGLYGIDLDTWAHDKLDREAIRLSQALADRYAVRTYSNCSTDLLEHIDTDLVISDATFSQWNGLDDTAWGYRLEDSSGKLLESYSSTGPDVYQTPKYEYTCAMRTSYPVIVSTETDVEYDYIYANHTPYTDSSGTIYYVNYVTGPYLTVTITMEESRAFSRNGPESVVRALYAGRYAFVVLMVLGFLLFAAAMVYLCCAAGRTEKGGKIVPGGLNRLPLDLYGVMDAVCCYYLLYLINNLIDAIYHYSSETVSWGVVILTAGLIYLLALLGVGYLFALAAQCKTPGRFWWRHSAFGWCWGKLCTGIRWIFRGIYRLYSLLPVIWQWLLVGVALCFSLMFATFIALYHGAPFILFVDILVFLGAVCYGAYAFGTLLKGAKQMAEGNLNTKISTKYLVCGFAQCADRMNALADAATVAARKQMRSDRMKTELITNVSHDIKTPLTSIINYVDLLQNTDDPQDRQTYLEVLSRQSQSMKRLLEDLMDMSKATTGNMPVEITQVDAVEAVNQALGEFADKLAGVRLTPVFRKSAPSVAMLADGRLTWRVLNNLLSNAVKYALPGTRLYIDLTEANAQVVISLKNISREALNISADELTERFVRGDASRNTEGSGLGLNIAKSLMELQRGSLDLLVDGDLFKVTLTFPGA